MIAARTPTASMRQSSGVQNMYQGTDNFPAARVSTTAASPSAAAPARSEVFRLPASRRRTTSIFCKGKHQIAFGVDVLRTRDGQNNHYQDNGVFNFSGQYTNDPLLDFLLGQDEFVQPERPAAERPAADDFPALRAGHISRDLEAGDEFRFAVGAAVARVRPFQSWQHVFTRGVRCRTGQQVYVNAPAGSLFYGDPGISKSFTNKRMNNLSPRLGFVYNPDGSRQDDASRLVARFSTTRSEPSFPIAWWRRIRRTAPR